MSTHAPKTGIFRKCDSKLFEGKYEMAYRDILVSTVLAVCYHRILTVAYMEEIRKKQNLNFRYPEIVV